MYFVFKGDFSDIDVVQVVNSSTVEYKVSEDTSGIPDIDTVALSLAGVVSDPFSVSGLSASNVSRI